MSYKKYYVYKKQYTTDGTTWADVVPAEWTPSGDPIGTYDTFQQCGENPPQYRTISGTPYCNGYDKYVNTLAEISFDNGSTWEPASATSATVLVERNSVDCGYVPVAQYRWVDTETTICVNDNKYYLAYKEVSYDGGQTWQEVVPRETSLGTLIESQACECMTHAELLENGAYSFIGTHGGYRSTCQSSIDYVSQTQVDAVGSPLLKVSLGNCINRIISYTFDGEKQLVDVFLPESLRTIGEYAFDFCVALKCVNFPNGLQSIGNYAFARCRSIKEVILPDTVTDVASTAFQECGAITTVRFSSGMTIAQGFATCGNLSNVTIPYGVRYVGNFQHCSSLRNIEIPHSVISVGGFANSGLQSITIPNSVRSIGGAAFDSTPLTSITFESGTVLDFSGKSTFKYCQGLQTIELPNGTTSVVEDMFAYCARLTSVTLPDTVRSIGKYAFANCLSLNTLVLKSVTPPTVGSYVFDTARIPTIYVPCGSLQDYCTSSGWSAMCSSIQENPSSQCRWVESGTTCINCGKYLIKVMEISYDGGQTWSRTSKTSRTIIEEISPECGCQYNKLTEIYSDGSSYVLNCTGNTNLTTGETKPSGYDSHEMTTVVIGDCATGIGQASFYYCSGITTCRIGSAVTFIGGSAFSRCYNLKSIDIPDSVTSIGNSAFEECYTMTSCTIGRSVTSIGNTAFYGCGGLPYITIRAVTPPSLGGSVFNITNNCPIYVPCASVEAYKTAAGWSQYADRIQGVAPCEEYRTTSGTPYCNGYDKYIDVYTQVSYDEGSTWITTATTPTLVEANSSDCMRFKVNAKYSNGTSYSAACDSNSTLETGDTKPSGYIDSNMRTADVGACITYIGDNAFSGCTSLSSVTIPNSVTYIGYNSFRDCTSLSSVTIPNSVTSIGYNSFRDCTSLKRVNSDVDGVFNIPSGVTSISYYAFYNCSSLTSVNIPSGVTYIASYTFQNCTRLANINIPSGVTSIGNYAFSGCTSLPVTNYVRYADTYAVGASVKTLSSYSIKEGTRWIGNSAFENCSGMTSVSIPNSVISIGEHAFDYCTGLTSVNIPSGVTSIGYGAFAWCYSLTNVEIPSGVTYIGSQTFQSCRSITNITIPDSVTTIENFAFNDCTSLISCTIGSGVTRIGQYAFLDCTSLSSITVNAITPPTLGTNVFYNTNDCPIYVPSGSVETYKTASGWSDYASRIQAIP